VTSSASQRRTAAALLAAALLAAALLAGQAGTDAFAPAGRASDTGRTLGRTGDAYLSGLRIFAALVLWNRLDAQYDAYYGNIALKDQKFLMPNFRLVLLLDPQFVQAYYDVPWILADNGRIGDALVVAREGIANNPRSGLLRIAYAQYLYLFRKDPVTAAGQVDRALAPDIQWRNDGELWEGLRVAQDIYRGAGEQEKYAKAAAAQAALAAKYGGADKIPGDRGINAPRH
jgi:hypothetical protein